MILRIGWLTPFNNRTGVGTFSKAITDAMPAKHEGREIQLTIIAPLAEGLYRSRHRIIDIHSTTATSRFFELFDLLIYNIGNNEEHHKAIFDILRNHPGVVICHDHVYQHVLAKMVHDRGSAFADYVALAARYGSSDDLRRIRQSNITQSRGLRYAMWDSDHCAEMPLGAPLFQLGSALVVHSRYAETHTAPRFDGPVLRLGMPHDQRAQNPVPPVPRVERRRTVVSFGHVQSTKCIHDVLLAIAGSSRLRDGIVYVISGFSGDPGYLDRLRALISEHALESCVRFALNLSDEELSALCSTADAFINLRFPNTEGASVSLIEQLLTGRPVVVFDTGCYAEVPDDAVIKVARVRDTDAIARAIHRLLEDREALSEIGERGRIYGMRTDCRSYVQGLLDFIAREESLLRRRSAAYGYLHLDVGVSDADQDTRELAVDDPWIETLATARATLDLLEQGRLAHDPTLIKGLSVDALADFVQAAILRSGTNQSLGLSLRSYLGDGCDTVRRSRILRVIHEAAFLGEAAVIAVLPEIVPHEDMRFWEVVDALGENALTCIVHGACFGSRPEENDGSAFPADVGSPPLRYLRLVDDLERRSIHELKVRPEIFSGVVDYLRRAASDKSDVVLDTFPVGQTVDIGSSDQHRFLELAGFYDVTQDHVWSKPQISLLYVSPVPGAAVITLSGYTLVDTVAVTVTASTRSGQRVATKAACGNRQIFELALPDAADLGPSGTLCLAIQSSGCLSPADLGPSQDMRPLGFRLQQVAIR